MRQERTLLAAIFSCCLLIEAPSAQAVEGAVPPNQAPFQWTSIGPSIIAPSGIDYDKTPSSGRVSSLNVSGTRIIAATANGGVWARSAVVGQWTPLTDGLSNLSFGAVAIAASSPNIMYAATGESHACVDCGYGDNVYKTQDYGRTWVPVASIPQKANAVAMQSASIAVNPTNPDIVWAGTTLGVFRSDNGGASWDIIATLTASSAAVTLDLKLDPSNPAIAYFTDQNYIWKYDPANPAAALSNALSVPKPTKFSVDHPTVFYTIAIAIAPSNPSVIYATYAYGGNFRPGCLAGLYRSSNRGASWDEIAIPKGSDFFSEAYAYGDGTACQGWYDNVISVDPLNSNHIVVGGIVLMDIDATSAASPVLTNLTKRSGSHTDQHAVAFDTSGNLYAGNDGGVWHYKHTALLQASNDVGDNLSGGLAVTQFSPGGTWLPAGAFLAGSQDNGTEFYSPTAGDWLWTRLSPGDGGYTGVDPSNGKIIYHEFYQGAMERSDIQGRSWTRITPPFRSAGSVSWVMPFFVDPTTPNLLLAGADGEVFVTTSGGLPVKAGIGNWSLVPGSDTLSLNAITSIDARMLANELVAGDNYGLVVWTLNGGQKWNHWQAPVVDANGTNINLVCFDAADKDAIYVGYTIASAPFTPHLIHIQHLNGVLVEQDVSSGLGAPVQSMLQTPHGSFLGTDRGVFFRGPASATWTRDDHNLLTTVPAVPVVDLKLEPTGASIIALTHGRGAWRSNAVSFVSAQGPSH